MKVLVTGGGGFLGRAIVRKLLEANMEVRSFARNFYPTLADAGVEQYQGNLANGDEVARAVDGCDRVFHVAAKAGVWGKLSGYLRANVIGTENVIEACRAHGVRSLVFTSTPAVVFDGADMEGVDESAPYPRHFHSAYAQTKARAEQMVLAANDRNLATVSLRPHVIWGPEDHVWLPRILERASHGELRIIGDGTNVVDTVYVDNAADAHLLAAERLEPGSPIAGRKYFISNGEPVRVWDLINRILAAGGLPPVEKHVPVPVALAAGWALETLHGVLRRHAEPRLTRFVVRELSSSHWFDISAARRDLGYEPEVSIAEGLRRLESWLVSTRAHSNVGGNEQHDRAA